jgi:hypothetical protein
MKANACTGIRRNTYSDDGLVTADDGLASKGFGDGSRVGAGCSLLQSHVQVRHIASVHAIARHHPATTSAG